MKAGNDNLSHQSQYPISQLFDNNSHRVLIMKRFFALLLFCLISTSVLAGPDKLVHVIRFSDYEKGSEEDWLLGKGFQQKRGVRAHLAHDLLATSRRCQPVGGDACLAVDAP